MAYIAGFAGHESKARSCCLTRREFIKASAGFLAAGLGSGLSGPGTTSAHADVFISSVPSYDKGIESAVRSGLQELGIGRSWAKGKSVMLKPNLVEPNAAAPHVTTHPAMVCAVAEIFRSWDAREVFVAEGPGHCRDSWWVLDQSGLGSALEENGIPFVDLNHDDVFAVPNQLGKTYLQQLYLPKTLRRADLIVSMPKMKTHHWVGVTLSMKNLFGTMPGICYGWPKNLFHMAGIENSILDIAAAVRPHLAIVDGIIGMEGDGPIMGSPIQSGVVVIGRSLAAVDATCTRLMGINPSRIPYLAQAPKVLGTTSQTHISQRGERLSPLIRHYALPPGISLA